MYSEDRVAHDKPPLSDASVVPGAECSIEVKSKDKKEEIEWRVQNWAVDVEDAAAYSLIQSYCAQPLARALSENSSVYAASTHLICTLLATVAHRTSEPAPKTWVNLTGTSPNEP